MLIPNEKEKRIMGAARFRLINELIKEGNARQLSTCLEAQEREFRRLMRLSRKKKRIRAQNKDDAKLVSDLMDQIAVTEGE